MIPLTDNNRANQFPIAAVTIAILCGVIFLWQILSGAQAHFFSMKYGFIPATVFGTVIQPPVDNLPATATMVTYMFLHGGWLHIIGNLLFLWVFAGKIEDAMGPPRFIMFYVACGFLAAIAQAGLDPGSTLTVIGASGAISGVLGAYLLLHPRAEITIAIPVFIIVDIVRLPAWIVLLSWFAIQLLLDANPTVGESGIAFRAHIGGFVAGVLLTPFFVPGLFRKGLKLIGV